MEAVGGKRIGGANVYRTQNRMDLVERNDYTRNRFCNETDCEAIRNTRKYGHTLDTFWKEQVTGQ